ncbi:MULTISPECIES: helix-turn-helix domain-containing protein [Streptomyces]|uniref:Helix-turn-helix transcriptional regulator n=1 Tax=Streptomyces sudanensis TaxID=436397 RepID=A0ABY4T8T7_9ACTN|nr:MULTISPECIES: helix-turn-helix transcriptional regulator [Streptomyces]MCP9957689.1 helix-turn-helix transcriptional regulator [Streptomyces sudanensis]MCP9986807.1 helix-turn-helix transcriptional regulator [Streptomyces sudanensis]MCQ0001769.1 helix-turn-helix transcriptional regulator [Streptomyces sudanensis]URN15379.1 helix-turn-helix transcriptional regulator [Streptomyces sudanensis]
MPVNTAAIVARRSFAEALKAARAAARTSAGARVKQIDLARAIGRSTIDRYSRLERGAALPDGDEWKAITRVLNLDIETRVRLETLLDAARNVDEAWWREFESEFDPSLLEFIAYEDAAARITACAGNVLPGILQRRSYSEALTLSLDRIVLSAYQMDRSAQLRTQRRRIFGKSRPPTVEAIIGEAALRQEVGGRAVMVDQLDSLIDDAESGRVTFRVIPFSANATLTHMFTLLEFDGTADKPLVAFDAMTGMSFRKAPREVRDLRFYVDSLRDLALPEPDSVEMMRAIRKEMCRD